MKSELRLQRTSQLAPCALLGLVIGLVFTTGCSREAYRKMADRDAYHLLQSRQFDTRWKIPDRTVEPDPRSRLADFNSPDCGPLPPDDPAAHGYMRKPCPTKTNVDYWDQIGSTDSVDDGTWLAHLPYNDNGNVELDRQLSVDLALMHSREFQTQIEQLYTRALDLSSNRFEYQLNWFGGTDWNFNATDDGFEAERDLGNANQIGFRKNLASGGQLAANLANSFAWNFGGSGSSNFAAGNLVLTLTQPLLRGAFRHVRTESLTQSERTLLYEVRSFARFRRQFYLNIVRQYLGLLNQAQGLRIEEDNLRSLELSLEEHKVLYSNGSVSPIQVDQIFQQLQEGRLSIINAEQSLQTSLDDFKFQLGLPARVETVLNEDILTPFQLNSNTVRSLESDVDKIKSSLTEFVPPDEAPEEFLDQAISDLKSLGERIVKAKKEVENDFVQWGEKRESEESEAGKEEGLDLQQQKTLAERIRKDLDDLGEQNEAAIKRAAILEKLFESEFEEYSSRKTDAGETDAGELENSGDQKDELDDSDLDLLDLESLFDEDDSTKVKKWKSIQREIARTGGLKERTSTLVGAQTQIRLFLIKIQPLDVEESVAVQVALENRLDLMSSKAAVVDAFRRVEVAADQLESDLNVSASADFRSDPTVDNAFRVDGDEHIYQLGLQFDGPLNRFNERNSYRASQLNYQQQRRSYMADEDAIVNSVRQNLRRLRANRAQFMIARQ